MPVHASAAGQGHDAPPPPPPQQPPPAPVPSGVRLVRVETRDAAWAGVAARDAGVETAGDAARRVATLAAGDAAALLIFAAVGRGSHGEVLAAADVLATAAPFLASWALAAPLAGGYSAAARGAEVRPALGAALRAWALAAPGGLALRCLSQGGRLPPPAFALVSLVATAVLLLGWRAAAAATAPRAGDYARRAKHNRSGGVLEFWSLLSGLTKRW